VTWWGSHSWLRDGFSHRMIRLKPDRRHECLPHSAERAERRLEVPYIIKRIERQSIRAEHELRDRAIPHPPIHIRETAIGRA
jgi:hypothetical protein